MKLDRTDDVVKFHTTLISSAAAAGFTATRGCGNVNGYQLWGILVGPKAESSLIEGVKFAGAPTLAFFNPNENTFNSVKLEPVMFGSEVTIHNEGVEPVPAARGVLQRLKGAVN